MKHKKGPNEKGSGRPSNLSNRLAATPTPKLIDEPREVVYADGSVVPITEGRTLRRILVEVETRKGLRRAAAYVAGLTDTERQRRNKRITNEKAALRAKRAKHKEDSSRPRNAFAKRADAKQVLLEFKAEYERTENKSHGWQAAAQRKFLIDPATLKRILAREK